MSKENLELVRQHFEAANRRDYEAAMAGWAEDVELVVPPSTFLRGTYSGREAVARFFGDWFRTFGGGPTFELVELVDGGDAVALHAHSTARGSRSGVELDTDYFYVYRMTAGRISHIQFYDDWTQALEAAGVSE